MIKLSLIIRYLLYTLFIIAPFLPWLVHRVRVTSSMLSMLTGGIKDILLLLAIMFMVFFLLKKKHIKNGVVEFVFLFLLLYTALHVVGDVDIYTSIDGIRHLLYYIVFSSLFCFLREEKLFSLDVIRNIICIQMILLVLLGLIEYMNPDIVLPLYGVSSREELVYSKLASANRLIGTFYNPIIYGTFLCLGIVALFSKTILMSNKFKWLYFWVIWLFAFWVVFFTLSRLAFVCYSLLTLLFIMFNIRQKEPVTFIFLILVVFSVLPTIFVFLQDFDLVYDRFVGLLSISTFTDNARIENWSESFEYISDPFLFLWGIGLGASFPGSVVHVENTFLSIFFELGIVGFLVFVFLNMLMIWHLVIYDNKRCANYVFLVLFLVMFYVMSTGNDFLKIFPMSLYYWVIIVFVFKLSEVERSS